MKKNLLLSPTPPLLQRKKTIDYEVEQGWSSAFGSCIFRDQGAKKVIFTACHSGKLKLTFTSPNVISTSPKNVLISRLISQFFCNLNSSKNFTYPSGMLILAPGGLSDTTVLCAQGIAMSASGPLPSYKYLRILASSPSYITVRIVFEH